MSCRRLRIIVCRAAPVLFAVAALSLVPTDSVSREPQEPADSTQTPASTRPADTTQTPASTRPADTTEVKRAIPPPVPGPAITGASPAPAFPSDTLSGDAFRARHTLSLDNFFESWPFYFLQRKGPVGAATWFSRYGIGRGRCAVYLGSVPFNDPQDGSPPLAVVPTTPIGEIIFDGGGGDVFLPDRSNAEGAFRIIERPTPTTRPRTFMEITRADRSLGQRRVEFSSIAGRFGVDIGYDDTRTNGYAFDARGFVTGTNYGLTRTRIQSANLRGTLPGGEEYLFSFRRFLNNIDGDLTAVRHTHRRDGHVASMETSLGRFQLSIFERTHKVDTPDSVTANLTTGGYLTVPVSLRSGRAFSLGLGYENILSRQEIHGNETRPKLQRALAGANGVLRIGGGFTGRFDANVTHYVDMSTGWGGRIVVGRSLGSKNEAILEVRRAFRMPNLGELYLPSHYLGPEGPMLLGNRYVKGESSSEIGGGLVTRFRYFENEARATAMRMSDPILLSRAPDPSGSRTTLLIPENGEQEDLLVLCDRLSLRGTILTVGFRFDGAVSYVPITGNEYFASVPETRTNARLSFGRAFFKNTSEFWISGEHEYSDRRRSGSRRYLPAYSVYNLKLDFRLVTAHIYVQWLNASDEKYVTIWPYLMTPRTLAYGIEWTLFE